MLKSAITFSLLALATPLAAQDLIVQFDGGVPKDHISFEASDCNLSNAIVLLDLTGSAGGLSFDATPMDSDAKTPQPVEITSGYGALSNVRDGDMRLQILVHMLPPGEALKLSANLGDTPGQETTGAGAGSEISGASIRVALSDRVVKGTFDMAGTATISLPEDASVCMAAAN